jgi:predicted TIM-barrel fold metal-dependent hydrolase
MDYYGIRRAVVFHHAAVESHPAVGNELLMRELADCERLLPQWVVLPESTREFPAAEELGSLLNERRIPCVRMAPREHEYSFASWCCGSLLDVLSETGIPVFIRVEEISWNELAAVLSEFPELRVVLTDTGYRVGRNVHPLLRRFPNLHMEYSGYAVHWGLEDLCGQIGPERFVFGSGLGREDPGVPLTVLALADLPAESKQLLAAKNLARLLRLEET